MRYNVQSAEVLNEADRAERILDYQLFTAEQITRLYGYNPDVEWRPGDPIHQHPHELQWNRAWDHQGICDVTGNVPRPMFQLIELWSRIPRCMDCDVDWRGADPCFVCGKVLNYGVEKAVVYDSERLRDVMFRFEADFSRFRQQLEERMRVHLATLDHQFSTLRPQYVIPNERLMTHDESFVRTYTEAQSRFILGMFGPDLSLNDRSRNRNDVPTPPPNPYLRPPVELELIPEVAPEVPDEISDLAWELAPQVDVNAPRVVPMPQMPAPRDYSDFEYEPFYVRNNRSRWNR